MHATGIHRLIRFSKDGNKAEPRCYREKLACTNSSHFWLGAGSGYRNDTPPMNFLRRKFEGSPDYARVAPFVIFVVLTALPGQVRRGFTLLALSRQDPRGRLADLGDAAVRAGDALEASAGKRCWSGWPSSASGSGWMACIRGSAKLDAGWNPQAVSAKGRPGVVLRRGAHRGSASWCRRSRRSSIARSSIATW